MTMSFRRARSLLAVVASLAMLLGMLATSAAAQPRADRPNPPNRSEHAGCGRGRTLPSSQISIQLYSLRSTIREIGIEAVLAQLAEMGYRNVEPYSLHGLSADEFDALLREYHLRAPSRHGSTNEANWDAQLEIAKTLGQRWVGSGGFAAPGIGSYEDVLATAETLNRLGERSVANGTGKIYGHNHAREFTTQYVDTQGDGELKSAWEILVEHTDPRYVTFQVDVLWAIDGGYDVVDLLEEYGDRIELLHVKDGIDIAADGRPVMTDVGAGEVDWAAIFNEARGHVKQFIIESDDTQSPLEFAENSLDFLECFTY